MEGWNTGWPWDRNEAPNDLSKQPDFISLYYQHSEEESM